MAADVSKTNKDSSSPVIPVAEKGHGDMITMTYARINNILTAFREYDIHAIRCDIIEAANRGYPWYSNVTIACI